MGLNMAWMNLLLVTSFLLICCTHQHQITTIGSSSTDEGLLRRRATEIINDEKPIMHTYVDKSNTQYVDDELISLWSDAWTNAGWDIKILSWGDAIKHPEYHKYKMALDEAGICCLPRQTYLRHLAMSAIPEGGFYSEVYVFPLHRLSNISDGIGVSNGLLPNDGSMTIYDGVIASIFSGNKSELERITSVLFSNLERNAALSLQRIQSENPSLFNFRSDNMYDNIIKSSDDVCDNAHTKFIIRFHTNELHQYGFQEQSRAYIVKRWYDNYKRSCWA